MSEDNIQLVSIEEIHEEIQSMVDSSKTGSEKNLFLGLLKIVVFFKQTNVLFNIYTRPASSGFVYALQEALSTLFNLLTDRTFTQDMF